MPFVNINIELFRDSCGINQIFRVILKHERKLLYWRNARMTEVTVLDAGSDDIAGKIASGIEEYGGNSGDLLIRSIRSLKDISAFKTDVLVLSEDAGISDRKARISCKILLLPGDSAEGKNVNGEND